VADRFDLSGRVALVTGGNRGIGRGIATGLARAGANVVVAARDEVRTRDTVEELTDLGARAVGIRCDVQRRDDIDAAVDRCRAEFSRLDILVNNAGRDRRRPAPAPRRGDLGPGPGHQPAGGVPVLSGRPSAPARGGGKVINIGSEYSLFGSPLGLPYAASKGGVVQLTKSLAIAWARHDIQVNAIIPGWISTDMTVPVEENETFRDTIIARTPAGRFGEPDDLAGTAVFLASAASDFVTGQSLPVDGGYSIA
jgi:2-dehydro-3-deoxy-D-gluconate 5-dehydrogenase